MENKKQFKNTITIKEFKKLLRYKAEYQKRKRNRKLFKRITNGLKALCFNLMLISLSLYVSLYFIQKIIIILIKK